MKTGTASEFFHLSPATGRFVFRFNLLPALLALGLPVAGLTAPEIPALIDAAAEPTQDDGEHPPEGLAHSDWKGIRAAHEDWRHRFRQEEDGAFSARNPGQQWDTAFDGRGFLARPDHGNWEWGLELRGYGVGEKRVDVKGETEGVAESDAADGKAARLIYRRDAIIEEWFRNDTRGLEQGWTLAERPAGPAGEKLSLDLAVRGDLRPDVAGNGLTVRFVDDAGAAALTYGGLKAWDAEGRVLEARFVPEDTGLRIELDEHGAVYPVIIDPVAQQAYLKASNTDRDDYFGRSISISGDTVVVGASGEDSDATGVNGNENNNNANNSGAAYVFVWDGAAWHQQAYLKASNANAGDYFGASVSVDGDTVVIGAPNEDGSTTEVNGNGSDNSANNSGAAYVFVRNGEIWSQQAYLVTVQDLSA